MNTITAMILCSALASFTSPALAGDDDCGAPMSRWQPRAAILDVAKAQGWTVRKIEVDDGCYQIKGTDRQGRQIKAKLDPETLAIVKVKGREKSDNDEGHLAPKGEGKSARPPTAFPAPAPTSTGLIGKPSAAVN